MPQLGRKRYFLFAGLLVALVALMPLPFAFSAGAAAGWLLLFTARIRDVGCKVWSMPALLLVAMEMFDTEIAKWIAEQLGREATGYFVIALLITHVTFAITLGLQRSAPRPLVS
jgi:hypothetical protein